MKIRTWTHVSMCVYLKHILLALAYLYDHVHAYIYMMIKHVHIDNMHTYTCMYLLPTAGIIIRLTLPIPI